MLCRRDQLADEVFVASGDQIARSGLLSRTLGRPEVFWTVIWKPRAGSDLEPRFRLRVKVVVTESAVWAQAARSGRPSRLISRILMPKFELPRLAST